MSPKSLCVATPCFGGQVFSSFALSLIDALGPLKGENTVRFLNGDSLITRARNNLVAYFLKQTPCTHLLFIDADIVFTAQHVQHLIEHDEDIVCGLYPKKQPELEWVVNFLDSGEKNEIGALAEVKYAGTGFMLISREAILRVQEAHPELRYTADPNEGGHECFDIFGDPVVDGRKLSEDWFFCYLWRGLGGKIWVDRRVDLKHIGQITYPLQDVPRAPIAPALPPPPPAQPGTV